MTMAKVGTAYVEIKPDLTGFARELKDRLKAVDVDYKVDIKPNMRHFVEQLREELRTRRGPAATIDVNPDMSQFVSRLRGLLETRRLPDVKLQMVPDWTGFVASIRARLRVMRLPVVRLPVEVDDVWISRAMKKLAEPARAGGQKAATVWADGFSASFKGVMSSTQIGQGLVPMLSGGAGGPIGIAIALAAASVAVQFVAALTGSLLGLLGALSLVGLGIFGQRNDKEIKARAKKLGKSFTDELTKATASFKMPIMTSLDIVFAGLNEALKILKPTLDAIAPVLPQLAQGFSGFITEIAKAFADPATRDGFIKFLQVFAEELPKIGQAIGDLFRTIGQHADILAAVLRVFLGIVAGVFDVINGLVAMSADNFETLAKAFWVVKTNILVALGVLKVGWAIGWGFIKGIAKATWEQIWQFVGGPLKKIRDAVASSISQVTELFKSLAPKILGAIGDMNSLLWNVGRDIIQGLINGIKSLWGGLTDTISGIIRSIPDTAKALLLSHSPSLVMTRIGETIPQGLAVGISSGQSDVTSATSTMVGWAIPQVGTPAFAGLGGVGGAGLPAIRVYIGDRELTDIIRVEVDDVNLDTARALVSGRRQ